MTADTDKTRIDKWLWSIRFFKTRTLATEACSGNKVKVNQQPVKASYQVRPGDLIECKKDYIHYQLKVLKIISRRVSAPLAQECYINLTPEAELNKLSNWYNANPGVELREKGAGRPTKRERRDIDDFKSEHYWEEE